MTDPAPIPAATLVLMREGPGAPEFLMIERAANMAFAAGATVFPGGRIDPDDLALGGDATGAAKVAAIRETIEETGIAVALHPATTVPLAAALRARLAQGELFSKLLAEHGLELRPDALTPFARWCPNFRETRNFDTLFFIARAPEGSPAPTPDASESVQALWTPAARVLERADAGEAHIIFPTRRNLERLARFASFEEAVRDALAHPPAKIVPWIEDRGGEQWLCIPEDRGYPVTAERLASVRRG